MVVDYNEFLERLSAAFREISPSRNPVGNEASTNPPPSLPVFRIGLDVLSRVKGEDKGST